MLHKLNLFSFWQNTLTWSLFENCLQHLRADLGGFREPRLKKRLGTLETILVQLEAAKTDALTPTPGSNNELHIVRAVGDIPQCGLKSSIKTISRAKEPFGNAYPHSEDRCGSKFKMFKRIDVEGGPTVNHGEEGKVGIGMNGRASRGSS